MIDNTTVFYDKLKPTSVHCYEHSPDVYFVKVRDTNVHIATLSFETGGSNRPLTVAALLAVCLDQLQTRKDSVLNTLAATHVQHALETMSAEELDHD